MNPKDAFAFVCKEFKTRNTIVYASEDPDGAYSTIEFGQFDPVDEIVQIKNGLMVYFKDEAKEPIFLMPEQVHLTIRLVNKMCFHLGCFQNTSEENFPYCHFVQYH